MGCLLGRSDGSARAVAVVGVSIVPRHVRASRTPVRGHSSCFHFRGATIQLHRPAPGGHMPRSGRQRPMAHARSSTIPLPAIALTAGAALILLLMVGGFA